jgi:sulfur carrier protein ThiS
MRVTVRVMGAFRDSPREGERSHAVELPQGSRVVDALRAIGVGDDEAWNAAIDGQLVEAEHVLQDGEALFVFTPLAGGAPSPED